MGFGCTTGVWNGESFSGLRRPRVVLLQRLIPFEYLKYLFEKLANLEDGDLDELLPWLGSVPNYCRANQQA